jgi:phage recombination protein Bet
MTNAITTTFEDDEPRALAVAQGPIFTERQEQLIRDTYMSGASKEDAAMLMEIARTRRLNPLLKQVHFVSRNDKQKNRKVWSVQVSIDGLRAIAERTGKYDGQDEPEFGPLNEHGFPEWAKIRVYRKDWSRPAVGMVYWEEYVQTDYNGSVTRFWKTMPRVMLAKCAESVAMRKAFPEDLSGLYTPEEMQQADSGQVPPQISPHDQEGDTELGDPEIFEGLRGELATVDISVEVADTYDKVLALRAVVGSKGGAPTSWQKRYKAAYESMNGAQRKELGRLWNRCDRQLEKLEGKLKTDATAAFADDPEDFDRSA